MGRPGLGVRKCSDWLRACCRVVGCCAERSSSSGNESECGDPEGAGSLYDVWFSGRVADWDCGAAGRGFEFAPCADCAGDRADRTGGGGAGDVPVSADGFFRGCEGGVIAGGALCAVQGDAVVEPAFPGVGAWGTYPGAGFAGGAAWV